MRDQVLVRNHSTAQHATRHLHHQMVHGFMAFQMILVCWRNNDTWLMTISFWFFRAYSINEYKVSHFMTFQMVVCGWKSAIYILVKCSTLSSTHVLKHHERTVTHYYVIRELIVERDHSAAQNVTSHSQCQIFWSKMREQVLVRNHSTAQHATRHLHHQMVHGFKAFQMILVCGWKNDTG